jgi:hypothetical protein
VLSWVADDVSEAMMAMHSLLRRPEWRDSEYAPKLRAQLALGISDSRRHVRYLAVNALSVTFEEPERVATITRVIDEETDVTLLPGYFRKLGQWIPCESADAILSTSSADRAGGGSIPDILDQTADVRDELLAAWVKVHLDCFFQKETTFASNAVMTWFTNPGQHSLYFVAAVRALHDILRFDAPKPFRNRAFNLIRSAADSLADELAESPDSGEAILAADALIEELHFASGAHQQTGPGSKQASVDERAEWFADGADVLERLTIVTHAHSCYELLNIFEYFIDEDPRRVFDAIAATVKVNGMFRFETLGVDIIVRILDHYLAEYRYLFLDEPSLLTELRRMLEIFTDVGWQSALHLSYSLGDIFR